VFWTSGPIWENMESMKRGHTQELKSDIIFMIGKILEWLPLNLHFDVEIDLVDQIMPRWWPIDSIPLFVMCYLQYITI